MNRLRASASHNMMAKINRNVAGGSVGRVINVGQIEGVRDASSIARCQRITDRTERVGVIEDLRMIAIVTAKIGIIDPVGRKWRSLCRQSR